MVHYLAKFVLLNPDCVWIKDLLSCILAILTFDLISDLLYKYYSHVKKINYFYVECVKHVFTKFIENAFISLFY